MRFSRSQRAGSVRVVAAAVVLALAGVSCGTRVDRAAYYRSLQVTSQSGGATSGQTDVGAATDTGGGQTGNDTSAVTGGSAVQGPAGTTATTAAKATQAAPSGGGAVPGNVSTAVVGDTIRVGMHLPETGAAPLPMDWQDVLNVIVQYLNDSGGVDGRKIQFMVEDDGYDPSMGLAACRKLAEENALFVIGHTAPSVEDACAGLFQSQGIPYLMRGTDPSVLKGRSLAYFGTTPDDTQGALLGDYAIRRLGGATKKSAVVYENDQPATKDNFVQHVKAGGGSVVDVEQSTPRQADYGATIQKLQQSGAQLVLLSLPPVDAIKLSVQAQGQGYHPTWLGGGTYWNYNLTLQSAGMAMDGAVSFSPWAACESAAASEYRSVYAKYRPGKDPPDIGLVIWGWAMLVKAALEKAGSNLSRAALVGALNSFQFSPSYWNPVSYTATDHRGASSVAVFVADGQAKVWRQVAGFTTAF